MEATTPAYSTRLSDAQWATLAVYPVYSGKQLIGCKCHVLVDGTGPLLVMVVTAANINPCDKHLNLSRSVYNV